MPSLPELTVVVVASRRRELLSRCLDSVRAQREVDFSVRVVLNGATEATRQIAELHAAEDPRVELIAVDAVTPAEARNLAVSRSGEPIVYYLDDDAWLPDEGALARIVAAFERDPELAVIGGPNLTPPDDPQFAHLSGALLGSRFATGPTAARYRRLGAREATERELILCNLAVRREALAGWELPAFFPGEENALLSLMRREGRKLAYDPALFVYHHRRASFGAYLAHVQFYGRGRAFALWHTPRAFHPLHALPVLLLAYVLSVPLWVFTEPLLAAPLGLYVGGCALGAASVAARERRAGWLPMLALLLPLTHFAYAVGLLGGLTGRLRGAIEARRVLPERTR